MLTLCLTGLKSIDNTEWICSTCHSNLKAGKLPTCAKANKMTFPEKPDVLKDLTPGRKTNFAKNTFYASTRTA